MPFEACPRCGYALSILDQHCRHCAPLPPEGRKAPFDATNLPQLVIGLVGLGLLVHFIFRHGFS